MIAARSSFVIVCLYQFTPCNHDTPRASRNAQLRDQYSFNATSSAWNIEPTPAAAFHCTLGSRLASILGAPSTAETTAEAAMAITVRAGRLALVSTGHSTATGRRISNAAAASGLATRTMLPLPATGPIAVANVWRSSTSVSDLLAPPPPAEGVSGAIPASSPAGASAVAALALNNTSSSAGPVL